ncbi:MAG TPA: LOG family protein [Blastocatellia bacterium]
MLSETAPGNRITVFGGSRCGPDADEYKEALKLGHLLVEAGFDVCSGGYSGVMEAISRGAHEAGGHVIGVTMEQFKVAPNPYLKKIEPSADFYARLQTLIRQSEGYIALRGGMGTVTEISLVWNKLQMKVLPPRPLILLGDCWPQAIGSLREHLVISDDDMAHLQFAGTPEEAVGILRERIGTPNIRG